LLTDVMMPRMGGLTLARSITKTRPKIRVAYMTGHAEREPTFREALRSGAEAIQKPFTHAQLMCVVRQALESVPAGQGQD
jgi:two-component system cell cycle sensor histidine kinase/response regulator CckA